MRLDSPLGPPSLAPVTHARACPRCGGRLVQLEDPTCLPCGWVDYSVEGLTCGICRADLPATRQRFCSDACSSAAKTRRHQGRARQGLCLRCAAPTNGRSYCPRHVDEVARGQLSWRSRRLAAGLCLKCSLNRINSTHCEYHRQAHNAAIAVARQARIAAGRCRQCVYKQNPHLYYMRGD